MHVDRCVCMPSAWLRVRVNVPIKGMGACASRWYRRVRVHVPPQDENGQLQCDDLSDVQFNVALGSREWFNGNRGGASVVTQPAQGREDVAMLTVFTGPLPPLHHGERLVLAFRLLLTPVRGSGTPLRADFGTRYFHMQV